MAWTPEKRQKAVDLYTKENPTPENSMEIIKDIVAPELEESPNGVRLILTNAGVYVKKEVTATTTAKTGGTRVSKQAAVEALTAAIKDAGQEVDEDIVNKLTGKAAQYFTALIDALNQ